MDPLFDFTIYGIQVYPVLIFWELCHTLENSSKISPDGLQIYEQVSITLCTILTLTAQDEETAKKPHEGVRHLCKGMIANLFKFIDEHLYFRL